MVRALISIPEAGRRLGVDPSVLRKQAKAGVFSVHDGRVFLDEVEAGRAQNLNHKKAVRRRAPAAAGADPADIEAAMARRRPAAPASAPEGDDDEEGSVEALLTPPPDATDPQSWTMLEASRQKEIELAVKHRLANEEKRRSLISREVAERTLFDLARENRDAWMAWPSRVAIVMASELEIDPRTLNEVLTRHARQHLDELGLPDPESIARSNPGGGMAEGADPATEP